MAVYFKVYYRRSRQPLATYDERQIVDFCMSNKDTIANYLFTIAGSNDFMEWEVFAVKYSHLFVQRAKMREQEDRKRLEAAAQEEAQKEIRQRNRLPFYVLAGVAVLVVLVVAAALIYQGGGSKEPATTSPGVATPPTTPSPASQPAGPTIAKRAPVPGDTAFVGKAPDEKTLAAVLKKIPKLSAVLTPVEIKEEMDKYLPGLQQCFTERAKAGDRGLKGTLNMKIRVAGNGTVLDVVFPDEKYRATLFADCVAAEIKSKKFRPFRSQEQVFSYYFDL